jgi:very-short-patch-repair endonuclease
VSVLECAIAEARAQRLVRDRDLLDQLARNRGRRGVAVLRQMLARERGPVLTRSEAERRIVRLFRAAALPQPEANARIHRLEVDFLWRSQRVVVEVDGYRYHSNARAFERDRERDGILVANGYAVIRVTWRQLVQSREAVIARVAAALALGAGVRGAV